MFRLLARRRLVHAEPAASTVTSSFDDLEEARRRGLLAAKTSAPLCIRHPLIAPDAGHRHTHGVVGYVTVWPPGREYELTCGCGWSAGPYESRIDAKAGSLWLTAQRATSASSPVESQ